MRPGFLRHETWSPSGMRRAPQAEAAGPFFRQHRRQGSVGAWGSGAGGRAAWPSRLPCPGSCAPAHMARTSGLDLWQCGGAQRGGRHMQLSGRGLDWRNSAELGGFLRIVLDGRGHRNRLTQPCTPSCATHVFLPFRRSAPGVPGADLLLSDRAAVPCRPVTCLERGPTAHGKIRTPHRSSEPRVVLPGPRLAGADTGTNEGGREASRSVRVRGGPELRCDRGTVRAASWRGTCRACPAPRCSG